MKRFSTMKLTDNIFIKLFEILPVDHLKSDQDCHDFTEIKPAERTMPILSDQKWCKNWS